MDTGFRIGNKVIFLNQVGTGTVIGFDKGLVLVEDENGFEIPYSADALILQQKHFSDGLMADDHRIDHKQQEPSSRKKQIPMPDESYRLRNYLSEKDRYLEVDLHIHELIDSNRNMSNFEMLRVQMSHFERMIDMAVEQKLKKVVFIHGVGEGVLKSEIRKALEFYPNCRYRDADHRLYGTGATEVLLWYN
jgi:hypothetical protein